MRISIVTKKRHLLFAAGDDATALEATAANVEWVSLEGDFEVATSDGDATIYEDDETRYDRDVPDADAHRSSGFGFARRLRTE